MSPTSPAEHSDSVHGVSLANNEPLQLNLYWPAARKSENRLMKRNRPLNMNHMQAIAFPQAFSLIELLMAMGIIVLLAALLIMPIRNILGKSKENATRATILKIDNLIRQAQQEMERASPKNDLAYKWALSEFPDNPDKRDRWANRMRLKLNFPQTEQDCEALPNNPIARLIAQKKAEAGINGQIDPDTVSSSLMYILLTDGAIWGVPLADADKFTANEVQDTNGDGLMEFVDAWGKPLKFYRWPTGLVRPVPECDVSPEYWSTASTQSRSREVMRIDPLDYNARDSVQLSNFVAQFYDPNTMHAYLILSAGADGQFGLVDGNEFVQGSKNDVRNISWDENAWRQARGHLARPKFDPEPDCDRIRNVLDFPEYLEYLSDNISNLQLAR